MSGAVRTAHLGTFDAEARWRPDDLALLPAVADGRGRAQVAAMDEMLAVFCAPGDLLVTRHPVPSVLRQVFAEAGYAPRYLSATGAAEGSPTQDLEDTVERVLTRNAPMLAEIAACPALAPYAVLPDTRELAGRTGHADQLPDAGVVARVNSKVFSDDLAHRLGLPGGRTVRSVAELTAAVQEAGPTAVIKDPFGVGGRGILEVDEDRPAILRAIARSLEREVAKGKRVELVVQPKWAKRCDFSGYLDITRDGRVEFLGMRFVEHRGLSHVGVGPLPGDLADEAYRQGYPETLVRLGAIVAAEGYWGPVGVDSLLLDDGRIVPVLEVNARRSIGMLGMAMERRLGAGDLCVNLWRLSLGLAHEDAVDRLIDKLDSDGALHTERAPGGILPLGTTGLRPPRGRLECALVCPPQEVEHWRQRLTEAAQAVGATPMGAPPGTAPAAG
ncbi:hypothetical protein [Streptomyces sp. S.PNR 29]|uniref:hypothetical protein n=1 Tax=Streptomyces sp. S.PNR 29 TaxID=2973805 RepID=UPI0025B19650|nr:hypothetical protein [Streptomyces sp. S.PNR 29]MDN0201113.1 hypothetical protein [Streptomyces sp. S.PNR 29]